MANDRRKHFADPLHQLLKTQYGRVAGHYCDICLSKLAGLVGHRCNACNIDLHDACADYFQETISFFAHPWHTLKLSRIPRTGWVCDLCTDICPPGSFAYRCTKCDFLVHPLCTMLPQTIRSSLHPEHDLHMVPSWGSCSSCEEDLPVWHYRCSCPLRLHIACVSGGGQGSGSGAAQGSAASQNVARPNRSSGIAKFLLKTSFRIAIHAATGGLASPVVEVLAAALN